MIKWKWFLVASLFLSCTFSGVIFWYYQVMNKSLEELEYTRQSVIMMESVELLNDLRYIHDLMRKLTELRPNSEKHLKTLACSKRCLELNKAFEHELSEYFRYTYDPKIDDYSNEVFTIWENNDVFISEGKAAELYEKYRKFQQETINSYNQLGYTDSLELDIPEKDEFITGFKNVPLGLSRGILTRLYFESTKFSYRVMDNCLMHFGICCYGECNNLYQEMRLKSLPKYIN